MYRLLFLSTDYVFSFSTIFVNCDGIAIGSVDFLHEQEDVTLQPSVFTFIDPFPHCAVHKDLSIRDWLVSFGFEEQIADSVTQQDDVTWCDMPDQCTCVYLNYDSLLL